MKDLDQLADHVAGKMIAPSRGMLDCNMPARPVEIARNYSDQCGGCCPDLLKVL